ncbi:cupin domain-containing protein [Streptomonospora halophila]|uniref:Cupin domain-containing protein n=1 Tax=Streptomonospora halophila TaxID=427369 RepID=A0ABP9GN64_9ACTN
MNKLSLDALARKHMETAAAASAGRSSETFYGGHEQTLRQTLIALTKGNALSEHPNPGEATVLVLRGRVRLKAGGDTWEGRANDLLVMPREEASLEALEDSAVVLTVAKH